MERGYDRVPRNLDTRVDSRLYHLRNCNNWVKATLIDEVHPQSGPLLDVLDLACGKGGDLGKWNQHKIGTYVGCDVARGSLAQAAERARTSMQDSQNCTFVCVDIGSDAVDHNEHLAWNLQNETPQDARTGPQFRITQCVGLNNHLFDVVSIQMALHYMFQTEQKARRFFRSVSRRLSLKGSLIATTIDARVVYELLANHSQTFVALESNQSITISVGGGACQLRFEPDMVRRLFGGNNAASGDSGFGLEYKFKLIEEASNTSGVGNAVDDLPEWLAPIPVMKRLGEEVGLKLDYDANFQQFLAEKANEPVSRERLDSMRVLNQNNHF